jgi:hypothetical protein
VSWAKEDIERMADAYYERHGVSCSCGGQVHVKEMHSAGSPVVPLHLHCEHCGETRTYTPAPAAEPWTEEQTRHIADNYLKYGGAYCPNDGTRITVERVTSVGSRKAHVQASCKRCGNRHGL